RQLASRARRRVRGAGTGPDIDLTSQRAIVDAFLAASRSGDFDALLAVLDPHVVLRADRDAVRGGKPTVRLGGRTVAKQALAFSWLPSSARPPLVNVALVVVWAPSGQPRFVLAFTYARGKIAGIDVVADPACLRRLDLAAVND